MTDDDFDKSLDEGFALQESKLGATADEQKPNADDPTPPAADAPKEEPKKDEPAEPPKPEEAPPADGTPKTEEAPKPPDAPKAPDTPEEPKPLTEEGVLKLLNDARTQERTSTQALQNTTNQVLNAYYPEGLSNILVDEKSGKELRTPQDVIDASGGNMTPDEAHQWLMNEQYKLDTEVAEIKGKAEKIAETTLNFTRDSVTALEKYEPLFKAYPSLQTKVYNKLMQQVKVDEGKGVILSAPDVLDHYDFYLEPYQLAFEHANGTSATNPTPAPGATPTPPAPKPTAEDRLDEGGDGGASPVDDPNDFAQQVNKELSRGF